MTEAAFWLHKTGSAFIAQDFEHAGELRELPGGKHQIPVSLVERIAESLMTLTF